MKKVLFYLFLVTFLIIPSFFVKAEIEDGVYTIVSSINNNKVLDLKSSGIYNGNNIQLYDRNNTSAQKWNIQKDENGFYVLTSYLNNNYAIDLTSSKVKNSSNIQLFSLNNTNAQKWIIEEKDGYVSFKSSLNHDYAIDIQSSNMSNGTNIQLYKFNGTKAQLFKLEKVTMPGKSIDSGIYTIKSAANNSKVMDVSNSSTKNGTNIQLYGANNTDAQKFEIIYMENGYYGIMSYITPGVTLDVNSSGKLNGTNLQLYSYNGTDAQQWIIKDNGDGTYSFISKCNGLYIDASNNNIVDGTNLWLYNKTDSATQKFILEEKGVSGEQTIKDGYYFINPKTSNKKAIDLNSSGTYDGNNIQVYDANSTMAQKWYVSYLGDGSYKIVSNIDNNFALTTENIDTKESNVFIQTYNNSENQQWIIRDLHNGYYSLITKENKYLDIQNGSLTNGTNIWIYDNNGSDAQQFRFIPTVDGISERVIEDGVYNIKSAIDENMVLDVSNSSTRNGTNVQLYRNNGTHAQKWAVKYIGNGYYKITSLLNTNKSLDVASSGLVDNTNIQLFDSNDTYAQQWIIKQTSDGYFTIVSNTNNLYVTVQGQSAYNGANINMFHEDGSLAQKFKFELTSYTDIVIDVSAYQGNIDWGAVKRSGIYGVILRVNDGVHSSVYDPNFAYNIEQVKNLNLRYGLYTYSYAENYYEGQLFASLVKDAIDTYQLNPTLGVYMDLESNKLTYYMGPTEYTDAVNGFLSVIPYAKIYTYKNYADTALNTPYLRSLITWIAQYYDYCTYTGSYNMWQFTDSGTLSGIPTLVDMSHFYP